MDGLLELLFSPAGLLAVGAATGWVGRLIMVHVVSRVGNKYARGLIERLWAEVRETVEDAHRTYTADITKGRADGTLTEDEKNAAREHAIAVAKSHLGWKRLLPHVVKIFMGAAVSGWLENKATAAIKDAEAAGDAAVKASPPEGAAGVVGDPTEVE